MTFSTLCLILFWLFYKKTLELENLFIAQRYGMLHTQETMSVYDITDRNTIIKPTVHCFWQVTYKLIAVRLATMLRCKINSTGMSQFCDL